MLFYALLGFELFYLLLLVGELLACLDGELGVLAELLLVLFLAGSLPGLDLHIQQANLDRSHILMQFGPLPTGLIDKLIQITKLALQFYNRIFFFTGC